MTISYRNLSHRKLKGLLPLLLVGVSIPNCSFAHSRVTDNLSGGDIGTPSSFEAFDNNTITGNGGAISYNNGAWSIGDVYAGFQSNIISATSGDKSGGAIYLNAGTIGNVIGDFIYNSVTSSGAVYGGAIYNGGSITSLTSAFTGNYITTSGSGKNAQGGAIYNKKSIGNISGSFTGNSATSGGNAQGGVIYNNNGKIGTETTTGLQVVAFMNNRVEATSEASGGAIYNNGTIYGDIASKFEGNSATSTAGKAYGGSIYNKGTMGNITGDIIKSSISAKSDAQGGAIFNSNVIGDITGKITGDTTIKTAKSETGKVSGGAIYNSKTMGSVTGAISNIIVEGTNVDGGVIYNSSSMKGVTGAIADSTISATTGKVTGGILYNKGTMDDISGDISNTKLTGVNVDGGIIYNDTNKSMGNVTSNVTGTDIDITTKVTGGIILNKGTMGTVSGEISDITIKGTNVDGGVIYNDTNKSMGNVTSNVSSTDIDITTKVTGGIILNKGTMGSISGTISDITLKSTNVEGGVIYNSGSIDSLAFDKIENLTIDVTGSINGAYLYNKSATSKIEEISDELNFNNITVNTVNGTISGLINNEGTINNTVDDNGDETSDIIINASNVTFGTKDNIYNANAAVRGGILVNRGNLGVVRGTIQNNTSTSGLNEGFGIGIYNYGGTIKTLAVDFINNVSYSKSQGPAIHNTGTLGSKDAEGNVLTVGIAEGSQFIGNKIHNYVALNYVQGGAIYISSGGKIYGDLNNLLFEENEIATDHGTGQGGAIANLGTIDSFTNSEFSGNKNINTVTEETIVYARENLTDTEGNPKSVVVSANARGGAIFNKGTIESITGNLFEENITSSDFGLSQGGAVYNEQNITNGLLDNTYIMNIVESKSESSVTENVEGSGAMGGAINNGSNQWGSKSMKGVIQGGITGLFEANQAKSKASDAMGGAIFNGNIIENGDINATFKSNSAISESGKARGGAISNGMNADIEEYTSGELKSNIIGEFLQNYVETISGKAQGGAVYNETNITGSIKDSTFNENYATADTGDAQGGAIYNSGTIASIENSNFVNNHAESTSGTAQGGAIYTANDLSIVSNNTTTLFDNNYVEDSNGKRQEAIYVANNKNLTLATKNNGQFLLNDSINGDANYDLTINGDNTGTIFVNNDIINAIINHNSNITNVASAYYLNNNNSLDMGSGTLNIYGLGYKPLHFNNFNMTDGNINLYNIPTNISTETMGRITADTYASGIAGNTVVNGLNISGVSNKSNISILFADDNSYANTVEYNGANSYSSPIYNYKVNYGINSDDGFGYFNFVAQENDFNPSVLETPIATLSSIYNAQSINTDYIFEHADYTMRYDICARYMVMKPKGIWVRPYGNHGHMSLSHAPKTTINGQGIFVGYDTDLKHLESNWKTVGTLYLNSNTSREKYDGVSIKQNSLMLGATQTFYKTHFFSAFTGNLNYINNKANNMYGKDKFDIYGRYS